MVFETDDRVGIVLFALEEPSNNVPRNRDIFRIDLIC